DALDSEQPWPIVSMERPYVDDPGARAAGSGGPAQHARGWHSDLLLRCAWTHPAEAAVGVGGMSRQERAHSRRSGTTPGLSSVAGRRETTPRQLDPMSPARRVCSARARVPQREMHGLSGGVVDDNR